jgi:hypothetical protein
MKNLEQQHQLQIDIIICEFVKNLITHIKPISWNNDKKF